MKFFHNSCNFKALDLTAVELNKFAIFFFFIKIELLQYCAIICNILETIQRTSTQASILCILLV